MLLTALSVANTLYLFTRFRKYQLRDPSANVYLFDLFIQILAPKNPSAKKVPSPTEAERAKAHSGFSGLQNIYRNNQLVRGVLNSIFGKVKSTGNMHWEIYVWDPPYFSLVLFWYSSVTYIFSIAGPIQFLTLWMISNSDFFVYILITIAASLQVS